MRLLTGAAAAALAFGLVACSQEVPEEAGPACDRACLSEMAASYVAALVAHDPSAVPLSPEVAFVENIEHMEPGQGLWETTTGGPTAFSITVPDEQWQSVGWLGMIEKDGEPTMLALRLKLNAQGEVSEVEHRWVAPAPNTQDQFTAVRAGFVTDVPEDARLSHDELVAIGASYYDALDDNDGSLMPFAEDCERHENGMITSGPKAGGGPVSDGGHPTAKDCAGQLTSGVMAYITTIADRDVFAADPVTGLAMGFSSLQHPMDFEPFPVTAIDGTVTMRSVEDLGYAPWDNVAAHVFKVGADHKVHEIEALGFRAESGVKTAFADTSIQPLVEAPTAE